MPPKGTSTSLNPVRLQSVAKLRIKRPDKQQVNPCLGAMSAMLSESCRPPRASKLTCVACWASSGLGNAGCVAAEQTLRECMDGPVSTQSTFSTCPFPFPLPLERHWKLIGNLCAIETTTQEEEHHQLSSVEVVSEDFGAGEEEGEFGLIHMGD